MKYCLLWLLFSLVANFTWAQSETATVSGQVVDPSGLNITGAQVKLVDIDRDTSTLVTSNNTGLYTFPSVRPGRYRMEVIAAGFKVVNVTGVTVNVQDHLEQNFKLVVGSVSESITVEGGAPLVDTESATVSTVVDRQFAENLPLNGRSFQGLIELTPGVVVVSSNSVDSGQFSINGQRAASNYWTVDGTSANIGMSGGISLSNGLGGAVGAFNAFGGTNNLVSVDAMQEFRIQTSTYAPEFGRTPGGQISIVTRSGTNQLHGTAFDYLRNDIFDANNWFNGYTNNPALPKAKERQNDFGGTFSGPILRDKTFFFFSYEGLRLRLPETTLTSVPDLAARQDAVAAMQPYLNAYPFDPNQPDLGNGMARFNSSYSNPASLDAYSLRIDHKLNDTLALFGRYNYSPSEIDSRGVGVALNVVSPSRITIQTATTGVTWAISPAVLDDLRFNYSRTNSSVSDYMDSFGGATPLASSPFPSPYSAQTSLFALNIFSLTNGAIEIGNQGRNIQRQVNIVDGLSVQRGRHSLKMGADFRRLTPILDFSNYGQTALFSDMPSAESGNPFVSIVSSSIPPTLLLRNFGLYAQDTWRIVPRLTVTYGLRWDVDFVPRSISGPSFAAVTGFNFNDLSNLALATPGTRPYKTTYGNIAPRFGIAYQLSQHPEWQTVVRGGFGVFYDLATSELGNLLASTSYPFGGTKNTVGSFPLDSGAAAPPVISPPNASNGGLLLAEDPHLKLPYTLEWNVALEQALGKQQTISTSYIGAVGRRLLQTGSVIAPNRNLAFAQLATNAGVSNYNALQLQFQRRMSKGLQAIVSYTWSHSIDTGSAGSNALTSNDLVPSSLSANRGPSDFDIRDSFSLGLTYDLPAPRNSGFVHRVSSGWSTDNFMLVRSAPPVDVRDSNCQTLQNVNADVRPDLVAGQPVYLYGSQYPAGEAFNPAAFTDPPVDPTTGLPARQGDVPRNFLRGFGATQWDLAIHRNFPIHESLKLQFRAEMFNVLNHPNFGPPSGCFGVNCPVPFGVSSGTLANFLNGGTGGPSLGTGSFSPLYQIGGPRSIQLALKLEF